MQQLNDLQKMVMQLPVSERVVAKRWIARLKQPVYYPKEQRINDKYIRVFFAQFNRILSKHLVRFESPFNLFPVDAALPDLQEYIIKRFVDKVPETVQPTVPVNTQPPVKVQNVVKPQETLKSTTDYDLELNQLESVLNNSQKMQTAVFVPQNRRLTEHFIQTKSFKQNVQDDQMLKVSQELDELLAPSAPQNDTSTSKTKVEMENTKQLFNQSAQNVKMNKTKVDEILYSYVEMDVDQEINELEKSVKSILKKYETHAAEMENIICSPEQIQDLKSKYNESPKSKLTQIENSYGVDYETTPYQGRSSIRLNKSYGVDSSVLKSRNELIDVQEENKNILMQLKDTEVNDKWIQKLLDLENRINQQDEIIAKMRGK
ncbi:Conserved_hypothetical protein [Hexamita inflata]|uniref:DUF4485 domain-containing protein n=1 Tax=Hexamita inflata TaxID=28002 RepID=A0AA86PJU9_9EUKA|nr:Conserved hypothetical protein [Hexamita inflata]